MDEERQNSWNDYPNGEWSREQPENSPARDPFQWEPAPEQKKSSFLGGFLTGAILALLLVFAVYTGRQLLGMLEQETAAAEGSVTELLGQNVQKKLKAMEGIIDQYFYEPGIDREVLVNGMYSGLIDALEDPYSVYYTEEDLEDLMEQTEGIYYGIGAYVSTDQKTGLAMISGTIEGTPAEEAGLRAGDIIYKVDGEELQDQELSEVVGRIKGLEGTQVQLTIYREGEADYLEISVERRRIESPTVNYEMYEDGIGYIQITEFGDITVDQFTEALAVLRGQEMKGLILDLRGNPGGNLSTVVEIAQQMLPEGLIVYTEDRDGRREEYRSDGSKEFKDPLVVLIDGYSASASEILAGAVKDYGIGTLVGTTTYGKGIVQRVISLSDGTAVKLTVSSYFTPNGNNIHEIGVEPDEVCEFDAEQYYENDHDNQLERAKEILLEQIR